MLTSVLALEIKSSASLHMRLARNERDDYIMRQALRGHVELVKQVLLYDGEENKTETLDDRWAEERYTSFQEVDEEARDERDPEEPVGSLDVTITARIEDEARKFNLHNLVTDDDAARAHWEDVFRRLVTIFREDYGRNAVSAGKAEDLLNSLKEWLGREDDRNGIPVPATGDEKRIMITPDELLMVKGFNRELLFDLAPDEEGEEPPPGLLRYLTLWSAGPVNLNTAEMPMVHALFQESDRDLADRLLDWRMEVAEEQDPDLPSDAEEKKNAITSAADLSKIDGFDAEVLQRNKLTGVTVTGSSQVFSVHVFGESSDGMRRQERWVLHRNPAGFKTLLAEERNDPVEGGREDKE